MTGSRRNKNYYRPVEVSSCMEYYETPEILTPGFKTETVRPKRCIINLQRCVCKTIYCYYVFFNYQRLDLDRL